jgi:glutaredoxin 3
MTAKVTLYTTPYCPFCVRAKQLLEGKQVSYTELPVHQDPELRREMMRRSGRHTVPQIWIDDHHVGGYDDLLALERAGKLDGLLQLAP